MTTNDESVLNVEICESVTMVGFAHPTLLDAYHITAVEKELLRMAGRAEHRCMVLDFSTVQMISSRALGVLLTVQQQLDQTGGKLVIAGIDPKLYRVFKVTQLESVFEFFDNIESALAAIKEA